MRVVVILFLLLIITSLGSALLMLLSAIDAALLEGYGWTPRCRGAEIDRSVYTEVGH